LKDAGALGGEPGSIRSCRRRGSPASSPSSCSRHFPTKSAARSATTRWAPGPIREGSEGPAYALPRGFIKVAKDTAGTPVSQHFEIGQFLTKDQSDTWPKYLVLDARLLDKLELTIAQLNAMGYPVRASSS